MNNKPFQTLNKNEQIGSISKDKYPTTKFDQSFHNKTTFDSGKLIPIFAREALPGDIVNLDVATLIRMSGIKAPIMDSPIYDIRFFYIPNRVIWKNWVAFTGENDKAGYQQNITKVPAVVNIATGYAVDDIASYMGIPMNTDLSKLPINSLYFKAYCKVFNDWYRDTYLQDAVDFSNDDNPDADVDFKKFANEGYLLSLQAGRGLAPVNKLMDYFTSCTPWPQLGDDTPLFDLTNLYVKNSWDVNTPLINPVWYNSDGKEPINAANLAFAGGTGITISDYGSKPNGNASKYLRLAIGDTANTNSTINNLRMAVVEQQFKELNARTGNRYCDFLLAFFDVSVSAAELDRAEYIGGMSRQININNVVQTSATQNNTNDFSPLGNMGAYSITSDQSNGLVNHACKEHGIILGLLCVRTNISYDKGLNKQFTRLNLFDYYVPAFNNIGEQPVYQYEINAKADPKAIFGYNEAWADYRWTNNIQSGYLSTLAPLSMADYYSYTETNNTIDLLNKEWIKYDPKIIGKTMLLENENNKVEFVHQFIADFNFKYHITRKMTAHSTPGLRRI